jgi:hypothetical protein
VPKTKTSSKKSKYIKELEKIIAELNEASKKPLKEGEKSDEDPPNVSGWVPAGSITDEERAALTKREEEALKKYMGYMKKNYNPEDMTTTFDVKEDGPTPSELRDIVDKLLNKKP